MSGNLAAQTADTPVENEFDEDTVATMSDADRRAFLGGGDEKPEPAPAPVADKPAAVEKSDDDDTDGVVTITADGKVGRDTRTGRFVPYEVYGKLRTQSKETATALEKERQERALEKGRYTELASIVGLLEKTGAVTGNEPEAKTEAVKPDPKIDAIGAIEFTLARLEAMERQAKEREEQTVKSRGRTELNSYFENDVAAFEKTHPDFKEALSHLISAKHAEFEGYGVTDKATRDQMLLKATEDMIEDAKKNGQSAAERLYTAAVKAFRYAKADAATKDAGDANRRLDAVKSGIAAAASLSGGGGGGNPDTLDLAKMSEDEYSALMSKLTPAQRRKMLGAD